MFVTITLLPSSLDVWSACGVVFRCNPWFIQTEKTAWKTMCDNGYVYPDPNGDIIPSDVYKSGYPGTNAAQDQAYRTAHRAIRQAVLDSYNAAVKDTSTSNTAAACTSALQATCSQTSNCNPATTGCFPENLQVACVEPKYFNQTFPTYTVSIPHNCCSSSTSAGKLCLH